MKRKFSIFFTLITCILCTALLAGCVDLGSLLGGLFEHHHNYSAEWTSDDEYHWHECQAFGCNEKEADKDGHADTDGDGECDVCGYAVKHAHDYRWVDNGDGTHKQHCDVAGCPAPDISEESHYFEEGGRCVCGADVNDEEHKHALTFVPGSAPTCTKDGNHDYYSCSGCALLFADADGQTQMTREEIVIKAQGHKPMENGLCAVCGMIDWEYDGLNLTKMCNGTYGYDYLGTMSDGAARQSLYRAIDDAVVALHNDVKTDYQPNKEFAEINYSSLGISERDAVAVWKTYRDDNPLYYWFSNRVGWAGSNLYLYVADEYLSGEVRQACNELIYEKIQEYQAYAKNETSAYQIALAFHDKIITAIDYAYDDEGVPEDSQWAHGITGVFEEKGAVCEGYAKAFQLLLNMRGIENVLVDGLGNGGGHAWNLIKLDDGQWYWCDLTWDDAPDYGWGIYYGYFCVNDTQGVDWVDGGNQYGNETGNGGIGGSPANCGTFLDSHKPNSNISMGTDFLYELPARSPHIYEGVSGELTLRDTFTADGIEYAVSGYGTVQVTKVQKTGAAVIPARVEYGEAGYTVASIGVIGGTKLFGGGDVFGSLVTAVTIPSSVVYIWSGAFYNCRFLEFTFSGTRVQWNAVVKMTSWKSGGRTMTVRCIDGSVTE